jgi:hypothetical protein
MTTQNSKKFIFPAMSSEFEEMNLALSNLSLNEGERRKTKTNLFSSCANFDKKPAQSLTKILRKSYFANEYCSREDLSNHSILLKMIMTFIEAFSQQICDDSLNFEEFYEESFQACYDTVMTEEYIMSKEVQNSSFYKSNDSIKQKMFISLKAFRDVIADQCEEVAHIECNRMILFDTVKKSTKDRCTKEYLVYVIVTYANGSKTGFEFLPSHFILESLILNKIFSLLVCKRKRKKLQQMVLISLNGAPHYFKFKEDNLREILFLVDANQKVISHRMNAQNQYCSLWTWDIFSNRMLFIDEKHHVSDWIELDTLKKKTFCVPYHVRVDNESFEKVNSKMFDSSSLHQNSKTDNHDAKILENVVEEKGFYPAGFSSSKKEEVNNRKVEINRAIHELSKEREQKKLEIEIPKFSSDLPLIEFGNLKITNDDTISTTSGEIAQGKPLTKRRYSRGDSPSTSSKNALNTSLPNEFSKDEKKQSNSQLPPVGSRKMIPRRPSLNQLSNTGENQSFKISTPKRS